MSKNQMKQDESLYEVIKSKCRDFCSHSTLHGAYYLCDPRGWLRGLWLLAVCCSAALCLFLSHMIWNKFVVDPTLTVVETTHYSTSDIPFPAVVICDPDPVHGPNTVNITNLLILRGYNLSQINDFYKSFKDVKSKSKDYVPAPYVKKMHYVLSDLGFTYKTLLDIFKKPCEVLLKECIWRSRAHNCTEMFRAVWTVVGYCCQFDVAYFEMHAASKTNFVSGVQITEALEISVSTSEVTPSGRVTTGSINMYVFDMKDRVTLMDSAIMLQSKSYFDVNVLLWAIDSSSYVKALDLDARKCILDTDGVGTSFYQGCLMRLILKKVVNVCKCLPFGYKAKQLRVEDYMACTWDRLICIYQEIGIVERDIREIISLSSCYQRCDYVQYETGVELVRNDRNVRNISRSESRVTVHFSEATCMKYRREVLYTWDQMLGRYADYANLGGIFGLCLGGSIVSILEVIWFIIELLVTIIHEAVTRKRIQPKAIDKYKNKVFIINQNSPKEATKIVNIKNFHLKKLEKSGGDPKFKFVH